MKRSSKGILISLIVMFSVIIVLLLATMIYLLSNREIPSIQIAQKQVFFDESYNSDDYSAIIINSDAGDIEIKNSADNQIRIAADGNNSDSFEVNAENGTINITSKTIPASIKGINHSADIDIYLPDNYTALTINSSFGDVEIQSINGDIKIDSAFGNINADSLSGALDLHTDMGNIDIDKINISESSSMTTDMGNIEINTTNAVNIIAETSMGNCKAKGADISSAITLTAKTDMGDIEIN